MSEQSMWKPVRKAIQPLDPIRIENKCEIGTPDVNYVEGWIELKIAVPPKRKDTILTIKHYTTEQRTWAIRRAHAGGRVWLFLKVSTEWLLFKGEIAAKYLGYVTLERLREVAIKTWKGKLNDQELREILVSPQEKHCSSGGNAKKEVKNQPPSTLI